MNRLMRRMQQFGKGFSSRYGQRSLVEHGRPQDVADPRAKNTGHGKKTADKWNQ